MSEMKKDTQATTEKKMTRYDMKMQRRKEMEVKKKKEKLAFRVILAVVIVAIVAIIVVTSVNNYQKTHGPYIAVGEHKIEKAEFDYYQHSSLNSFLQQYGSYAQYFGLDTSLPLDQQFYEGEKTWKDYFDEQAVDQIQTVYALMDEGKEKGFEHDATDEIAKFETELASQITESGMVAEDYIKSAYGEAATKEKVTQYMDNSLYASAYYSHLEDTAGITDEAIQGYYEENKDLYDSVDYLVCRIAADVPEEEDAEVLEDGDEGVIESESETELSEEEIEAKEAERQAKVDAAMAEAKVKADEMLSKITDEVSFAGLFAQYTTEDKTSTDFQVTGSKHATIYPTEMADWLFEAGRKAGDKTVIEYDINNSYYVVYFKDRYLKHDASVNVRHILIGADTTDEMTDAEKEAAMTEAKAKAEEVYAEWKAGEATEDSFAALADQYSTDPGSNTKGGLYEGVTKGQMVESFDNWIFDENRKTGDTDIVETEYGYHIMYFVGAGEEEWYASIKSTLTSDTVQSHIDDLIVNYPVSDPKGNLHYLTLPEETEAADESGEVETVVETE